MNKITWILSLLILNLVVIITPIYAQETQKQSVLDIKLHYQNSEVALTSIDKRQGFIPDYLNQPQNGYTLQINDKSNNELFRVKFNFPTQIISEKLPDKETGGTIQNLTEVDKTITTPSFESSQKLVVTDQNGQTILEHDFAPIVDPNLTNRGATKTTSPIFVIGLVIFAFAIVAGLVFIFIKRRSSQSDLTS